MASVLEINRALEDELIYARQGTFSPWYLETIRNGHVREWLERHPVVARRHSVKLAQLWEGHNEKVFDEREFADMVKKGTEAWANVPDNWLEELRGGIDSEMNEENKAHRGTS